MAGFIDLEVWKRSARLSAMLYQELSQLKDWGFRDQLTRSGLSVPSNIAEGHERGSSERDFSRFLKIAKGSCGEARTQIYIGIEAEYIDRTIGMEWLDEYEQITKMLMSLIKKLESR